ncbi:hypothetical protein MLD38_012710 [Melastoma candidum]|uniref:Uncharacterized protein n=1 Tax=Melastoma candidum TaxID=119954 RepID=A0ACB9R8B4_9MYRT|nr:hypothetical protein MLD38_012710 [Melastoma candidum]
MVKGSHTAGVNGVVKLRQGFYVVNGGGAQDLSSNGQLCSKNKEEELCCVVIKLRKNLASARRSSLEQAERLAAVDSLAKEREARLTSEKALTSI